MLLCLRHCTRRRLGSNWIVSGEIWWRSGARLNIRYRLYTRARNMMGAMSSYDGGDSRTDRFPTTAVCVCTSTTIVRTGQDSRSSIDTSSLWFIESSLVRHFSTAEHFYQTFDPNKMTNDPPTCTIISCMLCPAAEQQSGEAQRAHHHRHAVHLHHPAPAAAVLSISVRSVRILLTDTQLTGTLTDVLE